MITVPTPLVPTVQPRPKLPGGFWVTPDALAGWFVDHMLGRAGHDFPRVCTDLGGDWFGKRTGPKEKAKGCPSEAHALAHVCGCDPTDITFEEMP